MMKSKLLWISALLAAAGCSDTIDEQPAPDQEPATEVHFVRVGAATEEARASFDENLSAYWESGDEIKALMGLSSMTLWLPSEYNKTYSAGTLALESGEGTNRGVFSGEMETPWTSKGEQYFHFIYPADAGELSLRTNSGTNANHPVTCTITIPAEQEGRWIPYMWATTEEKTSWENLSHVRFDILSGALAIRSYENDRTTPKPLSSIIVRVEGGGRLVGTFTATTNGSLADTSFELSNPGTEIRAAGLDRIGKTDDRYEYRLNVAPGDVDGLELILTGTDGTVVTRHANAKTFKANTRSGLNVYWDDATISMDRATSWFEDQTLDGGLLYLDAAVSGAASAEEIGYTLDGTDYPLPAALSLNERIALPAGKYTVGVYAVVNGKTIRSETKEVIVTPIPTFESVSIRSSCTKNGAYWTTNSLDGNKIEVTYTLSDPFFTEILSSIELICDEESLLDLNQSSVSTALALRTHQNCRISALLQNGYRFESISYDTTLSGIPYDYQFYEKDNDNLEQEGWNISNTQWNSSYLDIINNNAYVSKQFLMAEPEGISYILNIKYYYWLTNSQSATIYVGTATGPNEASDKIASHSIKNNANIGKLGRQDLSGNLTLNTERPCIVISHNNPRTSGYLGLYSLKLTYTTPDE